MYSQLPSQLPSRALTEHAHDFLEGERVDFVLHTFDSCGFQSVRLTATIKQAFRPFTMSPVYWVSLSPRSTASSHGIPATDAVLKFYDRRSLTNEREEYRSPGTAAAYNAAKERAYRAFVSSVQCGMEPPLDFDDPWSVHTRVTQSDGAFEAYLAYCAEHMFAKECGAYMRLHSVQGDVVPVAYGAVTCIAGGEVVHGLLLEYIPAVSLYDVVSTWMVREPRLPSAILAKLCDAAVSCIRQTAEGGFLDEDIRPDNLLVREGALQNSGGHGVVLVDLADGQVRGEENDAEWAQKISRCNPCDTLGHALERLVAKYIGRDVWSYSGPHKSIDAMRWNRM